MGSNRDLSIVRKGIFACFPLSLMIVYKLT